MMRQLGVLGATALLLAVAACGGSDGVADVETVRPTDFEATAEYLASKVDDLESVPHRFEMTVQMGFEIDGEMRGLDPTKLLGEFDGQLQYASIDGGALAGPGRDEPVEQIVDIPGNAVYIRDPSAADALEEMPDFAVTDLAEAVAELGDKWGRADLSQLADVLPEDWRSEVTQVRLQGLDPSSFAGLVANAESVEELPSEEIQGEPMTGLAATVTAEDFAEAQQQSTPTTVAEPVVEPEPGSLGDLLASLEYRVEAWIDRDGNIRRLRLDQSGTTDQIAEQVDNPELEDGPAIGAVLTLDLFDYGDESIEVEIPDEDDTEDITAAFRSQFET